MNRFGPLYEIDHPAILAGFVLGAGLAVLVRGVVQARLAALLGDDTGVRQGRGALDLRQHVDAYSVVAWALGGIGWGTPVLQGWRTTKRAKLIPALAGPILYFGLLLGWITAFRSFDDPFSRGAQLCLTAALTTSGMAVLACVPVPPLDGWPILRLLAKPSPGLERARYQLEERNIGLAVTFALVVLPRLFVSLPDPVFSLAQHLVNFANTVTGG